MTKKIPSAIAISLLVASAVVLQSIREGRALRPETRPVMEATEIVAESHCGTPKGTDIDMGGLLAAWGDTSEDDSHSKVEVRAPDLDGVFIHVEVRVSYRDGTMTVSTEPVAADALETLEVDLDLDDSSLHFHDEQEAWLSPTRVTAVATDRDGKVIDKAIMPIMFLSFHDSGPRLLSAATVDDAAPLGALDDEAAALVDSGQAGGDDGFVAWYGGSDS